MTTRGNLDANENRGIGSIGVAVIELGDAALVQGVDEGLEGARFLRNGHRQDGLAFLAHFRAFGDVAQTVEVHVGTAQGGNQVLALDFLALDVFLDAGHTQGTGRLGNGAGILEHILDGRADFVGGYGDHLVHVVLADLPGVLTNLLDCHTISKDAHFIEHHAFARFHGGLEAVGVLRFDTNHLDLGAQILDVSGHAGNQPAATNTDEDGVDRLAELPHDFHGHRALAGDHIGIIVRRNVGVAVLCDQLLSVGRRLVEGIALENHLGTVIPYRTHLDLRRGLRHHNYRLDPEILGSQRHTLGMISGRRTNDTLGLLLLGKLRNPVIGTTNLEGKHRLKVFTLEQNIVAKALGQTAGFSQGCFDGHVIDARVENLLDVALRHSSSGFWSMCE